MIDWRHWHNEPHLIGGLILLGWLYALLVGPLRARLAPGQPFPRTAAFRFFCGLLVFYFAVGSPLDQIGERFLLSAHMVQHQLLMYVSAVLMLVGTPPWLADLALRSTLNRKLGRLFLSPLSCGLIFVVTLTVWHERHLYDLALQNKNVHVVEHIMFFGAALFYWWPVLSPSREFPRRSYGGQLIYLFAITVGMIPVFAYIAFSEDILYATYEYAPRIVASLTPQADQLLGAAIMKLVSLAITLGVMGWAFYRWHHDAEKKDREIAHR